MWRLDTNAPEHLDAARTKGAADIDAVAAMLEGSGQRPFFFSLTTAPGPISGLVWKNSASGFGTSTLVVGHSNNAGLRLFRLSGYKEAPLPKQPQQARHWTLSYHASDMCKAAHGARGDADSCSPGMQTLELEANEGSGPAFYQMALQQSSSLLLLAHSRRKSLVVLHIRGLTAQSPVAPQASPLGLC